MKDWGTACGADVNDTAYQQCGTQVNVQYFLDLSGGLPLVFFWHCIVRMFCQQGRLPLDLAGRVLSLPLPLLS